MSLQVEILQESFRKIKPQADEFVDSFYENLFTDYPASRPLFQHSDMKKQATMLKACLLMVVENLRHPGRMHEMLSGLGTRHVGYGALPEHYPLVGNSLLKTFEQYLKDDWTPDVKGAWTEAYSAITAIMLEGCDYSEASVALDALPRSNPMPRSEPLPATSTITKTTGLLKQPQVTAATLIQELPKSPSFVRSEHSAEKPTYYTESNFPALTLVGGIIGSGTVVLLLLLLL